MLLSIAVAVLGATASKAGDVAAYAVTGDAIAAPLADVTGDPAKGLALALDRARGNCIACHRLPLAGEPVASDLGPDLGGAGTRLSPGQLRLRVVDYARLNPRTLMPPYHRIADLRHVPRAQQGKPVLDAGEVEHVVAWLATLK